MRFLLCLCACLIGCGGAPGSREESTLQKIIDRGELLVGLEPGFHPFEMVTPDGEYEGFDIDLAQEFARDLEVKLRFVPMDWTPLQTALQTGQVDMIWSGMTATIPRSKNILFSDTYFRTRLDLLVTIESGITSSADLKGRKIAVKLGTTGETVARSVFPDCELVPLDDENNCATEVVTGRADAFLYDRFSIRKHYEKYKQKVRIVSDLDSFEPYAVAMRPGSHRLSRSVNLFLEKIRWDGRYAAIHKKYFGKLPDAER